MHVNYWQEIKENRLGRTGLWLFLFLAFLAALAPFLAPYSPEARVGAAFSRPSAQHWLGTNDVGQDVWSCLLYGARTSLLVGCGAALLAGIISVLVGSSAALAGGLYDALCMRVVDAFLVIPPVLVAILVGAYLKPHLLTLILLLAAFLWPGGARIIRAEALSLKEKKSVAAARTFGAGSFYIMARHIIPDLGPVLLAVMIQNARRAIFMEAGLSFLGVSDPTLLSWGKMMQQALNFTYLGVWKWWLLPPGLALSVTVTALTFIGYALEGVLNPRLRG
ncbi:peptide/nickel transport system permease protein [Thermanaeromonas toyohensis ToBE]|uniref:Peptide/nickel transport system permease protein n=1 Tax=Thermanaeromonas toyohensis ToBE TaxID=698762 RepID=A0A1W1W3J0_9FIRM|nr:ABC transporter permease [Thermanaeromonas toyohensis]SMB99654.1 peptide/nickel transport system permease protein [Thermanaeromonas toyohensis ToBE]